MKESRYQSLCKRRLDKFVPSRWKTECDQSWLSGFKLKSNTSECEEVSRCTSIRTCMTSSISTSESPRTFPGAKLSDDSYGIRRLTSSSAEQDSLGVSKRYSRKICRQDT